MTRHHTTTRSTEARTLPVRSQGETAPERGPGTRDALQCAPGCAFCTGPETD
jgi:hypothetical protein